LLTEETNVFKFWYNLFCACDPFELFLDRHVVQKSYNWQHKNRPNDIKMFWCWNNTQDLDVIISSAQRI